MNNHIIDTWYHFFTKQNHANFDITKHKYWKYIQRYGLPTANDISWKHISFYELFSHTFTNIIPQKNIYISDIDSYFLNIDAHRLVFINGLFSKKFSDQNIKPWKINTLPKNDVEKLPKPIRQEIFSYLTECLSYETIYILLPKNTICNVPLYLIYINQGISNNEQTLVTTHYKHHIQIEDNAHGKVIEHFVSLNKYTHFTGARISIVVGNNACIEHTKLICENKKSFHIAHNDIHGNRNSMIHSNIFNCFGNYFNRHQTSVKLNNQGSYLTLNSLSMPFLKNISNISTYVEHNNFGYTSSRQLHKIIANDQGQGMFHGLIKVNKQAIKTDGHMINKNLLLNQLAKIYTMPQLEIYADDVKCSHGATIGHIDKEQIFYLCTRGISYQEAYTMIIHAFIYEIIKIINNNYLRNMISDHIKHMLTRNLEKNDISHRKN